MNTWPFSVLHGTVRHLALALLAVSAPLAAEAQSYALPTNGDYGGSGPFNVSVDTFTNPVFPFENGTNLVVSVFHPNATINPSLPTVFFAHGYTDPVGNAADYGGLLTNLASQGYNVVFSPYEGGTIPPTIAQRFDELTSGFEAAVTNYSLNTNQVGFAGHSYGGGFLPAVIQHEMMGMADQPNAGPNAGHFWGGTAAFFYSMAPGYAYDGGGQTGVTGSQTISFPANLNVIEQVYFDDTSVADPRVAIDIFYNCTTLNRQKDFLTVYGDNHGMPQQVANHFLPTSGSAETSTNLQAWAIFRHLDALAAYTFTGDTNAQVIALGNGASAETYEGVWSDGTNVVPMGVTDIPNPTNYSPGPYIVQWSNLANPRGKFPLASGPPQISGMTASPGQVMLTVTNLLSRHSYVEQTSPDLTPGDWTNNVSFVPAQTSQSFTNAIVSSPNQFWRIYAP
jgi:hypothetical protein